MRSGSFFKYYNIESSIHELNPLCKILASIVFLIMVLISSRVKVIISLFLILSFIVIISNISIKNYFMIIYNMRFFLIFIFLVFLLFSGSIYISFVIVGKIILFVMYLSVLFFTTTIDSLIYGFLSFFRPLGIIGLPVSKICIFILLFLNFILCFFGSSNMIINSMISRGFDYKSSTLKDKFFLFKSRFRYSFRRICSIYSAIMVKNFGVVERSDIIDYRWRFNDFYMIVCHFILFILVLVKEVVM